MFALMMTQHLQSFGETLYLQLRRARRRPERLETARKMLLGQQDGISWLFHYLSDDGAPSKKAILRLFRTLHPSVERDVLEFAAEDAEPYRDVVGRALREIRRGLVDKVALHPTDEVLAVHYPAAFARPL